MKARHAILFAIGVILAAAPATAVPPKPINATTVTLLPADGTPDVLRKAVAAFSKNVSKANSDAETKRAQLDRQMEEGLDRAIAKAQSSGDINTVLALKAAKDQFATLTTSDVPLVRNALEFREKKTAEIETARVADAMKAAKELNDELEKAKKDETVKGNFDSAKSIADHQEKLVSWVKTLRSSAPQPIAAQTAPGRLRAIAQPQPVQRAEPSRTITIQARNPNGTSIGFAKAGDTFRIQYEGGRWQCHTVMESPDAPMRSIQYEDNRCCIILANNPSVSLAMIPGSTKQTPFLFRVPEDGEYALRAYDGRATEYKRSDFGDNSGSVRYSVQKVPSTGDSVGSGPASSTQQRPLESRNMESPPQTGLSSSVLTGTQNDRTVTLSKSGSPYTVVEQYLVPAGSELIVDAGVTLLFDKDSSLYSDGRLSINGTEREPVVCKGKSPKSGFWNGLFVKSSESNLDWVQISGAKAGLTVAKGSPAIANSVFSHCVNGAWVTARESSPSFSNSVFVNNTEHGIGIVQLSRARLERCSIENNGKWGVWGDYYGSPALENSTIRRNREGGIRNWGYHPTVSASHCIICENRGFDVSNESGTRWDFRENWWGASTTRVLQTKGDGTNLPNIRDGRDTNGEGVVDIADFLTAEPKDCGATIRVGSVQ